LADTHQAISGLNPDATVHSVEGDISDPEFVKSFVKGVTTTFSRIDYSVQCAGILGAALRSHETPVEDFDRINNINYKGTWLTSRAALGQMIRQQPLPGHPKQRGAVVNIASQLGVIARPAAGMCPFMLTKE
jgi:NAD(P)-dependent dehydrogenase (short-subunit alcohol dehydrogenase family)